MDGVYIFEVDDLDKLKDYVVGMKYDDFIGKDSNDSCRKEKESEKHSNDDIEKTTEKIDILRKAYLFDLYMLQNKYGKYMNDVVQQYKSGATNDKAE